MRTPRRMTRRPTGPGEILAEEFLRPLGMTQQRLANHIGCENVRFAIARRATSSPTATGVTACPARPCHCEL